jgi:hypothetical protein
MIDHRMPLLATITQRNSPVAMAITRLMSALNHFRVSPMVTMPVMLIQKVNTSMGVMIVRMGRRRVWFQRLGYLRLIQPKQGIAAVLAANQRKKGMRPCC